MIKNSLKLSAIAFLLIQSCPATAAFENVPFSVWDLLSGAKERAAAISDGLSRESLDARTQAVGVGLMNAFILTQKRSWLFKVPVAAGISYLIAAPVKAHADFEGLKAQWAELNKKSVE